MTRNLPATRQRRSRRCTPPGENDCILEVNTGGVYRGYRKDFYPGAWLLGEWNKLGGRVIITADAHDTAALTSALRKPPPPSRPQALPP